MRLPPVRVISYDEGREILDRKTRQQYGIGVDEYLRRYDAGEFREDPDDMDCMTTIPFARPAVDTPGQAAD